MSKKAMATVTDEDICSKYPFTKQEDHVRKKDMWAGSSKPLESAEYLMAENDGIELANVTYPPALYKCFDEALVNAIDYLVRTALVTQINVDFDPKSGKISIMNDGPGIEIIMHPHPEVKKYVPEFIFGMLLQGSNINKSKDSITGGTNGVGIKIANIMSTEFCVKTAWHGQLYEQYWHDGMKTCSPPKITKYAGPEFTEVSFLPDYLGHFNYDIKAAGPILDRLFRLRCYLGSAYAHFASNHALISARKGRTVIQRESLTVRYCGKEVTTRSMADIARLILPDANHTVTILGQNPFTWEVVVSVGEVKINKPNAAIAGPESESNSIVLTNVNGVMVRRGKHIKHIMDQIVKATRERIEGVLLSNNVKFKPHFVKNIVSLFINAKIPDVSWTSQRKDEVNVEKSALEPYIFDKKVLDSISDIVYNLILAIVFEKMPEGGKNTRKKQVDIDKYIPAQNAVKGKDPMNCYLLLPEGDSAASMCEKGIIHSSSAQPARKGGKNKKPEITANVTPTGPNAHLPPITFQNYGILNLRGVIMNVRKASDRLKICERELFKLSDKLRANAFFNALMNATGLNLNYRYEVGSPTYEKEMSELRYGGVIGFVDQDHAGVGFIFSLIINMFERFWPNLLKAGFVKRFATPVRRARPKKGGIIIEFYNDYQYKRWLAEEPGRESSYEIVYIKGLATNTTQDVHHMFDNFRTNIFTYTMDEETSEVYEKYFGRDADERKTLLKVPFQPPSEELAMEEVARMQISCSDHAKTEAKSHKLTNLVQKLYNAYDGMNESGRKILFGAMKKFARSNKEIKVAQLGGFISEHVHYHYGEQCLFDSIIGKAQIYVGAVQLPQLLPCSDGFGTRKGGDHGQARYLNIKLNKRLTDVLYPAIDNELLPDQYDDGERIEPKYFVPIIPMAIVESTHIPADGWKIKVWGRDVSAVIDGVRDMIKLPEVTPKMPPNLRGFRGKTCLINGTRWSIGLYRYDPAAAIITIDELPLRVWTESYLNRIKRKCITEPLERKEQPLVKSINPYPTKTSLGIEIQLIDKQAHNEIMNAYAKITTQYTDGIIEYFELKEQMDTHLNMIDRDGAVREFQSYPEVANYWFTERTEIYRGRIEFQKSILALKIEYYANVIQYIEESGKVFSVKGKEQAEAEKILTERGYARFNKTKLFNPTNFGAQNLEARIVWRPGQPALEMPENGQELPENDDSDAPSGPSYNYLLAITDRARLSSNIIKLRNDKEQCEAELKALIEKAALGRFPGAQIWLEELDKLEKIINDGFRTNWLYGDDGKYSYA